MLVLLAAGCGGDGRNGHLENGLAELRRGEFDAAAKSLEKAADKHPESATVHCNLGVAYWELGRVTPALASLRRAADLAPDDARPMEFLGQLFTHLERWEDARRVLSQARDIAPGAVRILAARALVEFRDGQPERAREFLSRALRIEPDYPPALYNLAQIHRYLPEGEDTAKRYFERYLGAVSHEDRHTEAAHAFLDRVAAPPDDDAPPTAGDGRRSAAALLAKARAAQAQGDLAATGAALKAAVAAEPDAPEAAWEMACFVDDYRGDSERAMTLFTGFIRRFPGDPRAADARQRMAELTEAAKQPALAELAGSEGPDPARASTFFSAGLEQHRAGNWDAAATQYRQALAYNREQLPAALNLGQVLRADGNLRGAIEAFEYALGLKPDMGEARYQLAAALHTRGRLTDAIAQAEKGVAADPEHARTYHLLGRLYLAANRPEEARRNFERYVQLAPDEPLARRTREWLDGE